ncbi:zinc finger protein 181-like, partial [Hetaerina americana]|uniref:zinc finger protein 181-like n=1 Tax=Hetaerina americana TaxID=62018 RepID=UPI003A7F502D
MEPDKSLVECNVESVNGNVTSEETSAQCVVLSEKFGGQSSLVGESQCGSPQKAGKVPMRSNKKPKVAKVSECCVCKACGRIDGRSIHRSAHMRAHRPKTYSCKTCARTSTDELSYNRHRLMHLVKEKPFKGTVCSKEFPHKQALALHMVTHTSAKPHYCELSPKDARGTAQGREAPFVWGVRQ